MMTQVHGWICIDRRLVRDVGLLLREGRAPPSSLTSLTAAAMRTCLLALLLIAASFVDAAKKKDKKKDLDELESLLENIDEDQETETVAPTKKGK
ncbi:hypothetical protein ANCDUO_17206 [Ancylostoma duodenale]|uniref:Uncharacterized protein n=1 Tax=Ancylostoma duodenale TaxID=51022 RepID=A0A0C2FVV0_9BILA|nr:hypothetical protein ANCDUO_17206 [Ancylostoma duodenale]